MQNIDFTSDDPMNGISMTNFEDDLEAEMKVKIGQKRKLEPMEISVPTGGGDENGGGAVKKVKVSASDKNPVMLLNELKPGLKYDVEECGDSPATKRFVMTVDIDGQIFEGSGASKKLAKQACARMALTALYNLSFTPGLFGSSEMPIDDGQDDKDQLVPGKSLVFWQLDLNESYCRPEISSTSSLSRAR